MRVAEGEPQHPRLLQQECLEEGGARLAPAPDREAARGTPVVCTFSCPLFPSFSEDPCTMGLPTSQVPGLWHLGMRL